MINIIKLEKLTANFLRTMDGALDALGLDPKLDDDLICAFLTKADRDELGVVEILEWLDENLTDDEKVELVEMSYTAGFSWEAVKDLCRELGAAFNPDEKQWRVDVFYLTGNSASGLFGDRDDAVMWAAKWQACGAHAFLMEHAWGGYYNIVKQLF